MRLIDADKMLAELKPITYSMEQNTVTIADMSNIMRNWVCRQPTVEAYGQWVSVEDDLPDDDRDVLVIAYWHDKYQLSTGWYALGRWLVTVGAEELPLDVTYWMPMPEPKEENHEKSLH